MTDNMDARWRLTELPGRQLILVKNFQHHIPTSREKVVAVAILSNGVAIFQKPTTSQWPPCKADMMLTIPSAAVTMDNLEDSFSAQSAAEIYLVYKLNRRHLLQLAVNNSNKDGNSGKSGKPTRKEV